MDVVGGVHVVTGIATTTGVTAMIVEVDELTLAVLVREEKLLPSTFGMTPCNVVAT